MLPTTCCSLISYITALGLASGALAVPSQAPAAWHGDGERARLLPRVDRPNGTGPIDPKKNPNDGRLFYEPRMYINPIYWPDHLQSLPALGWKPKCRVNALEKPIRNCCWGTARPMKACKRQKRKSFGRADDCHADLDLWSQCRFVKSMHHKPCDGDCCDTITGNGIACK